MTCGIYKIEAICPIAKLAGQAIYIGQSKNIEKRWKSHYKRFPISQYNYEILIKCDIEYLNFFEKAFISGYNSHIRGLNKTIGGTDIKSTHPSKETLAKIGAKSKGRKPSGEVCKKISESNKGKKQPLHHTLKKQKKCVINGVVYDAVYLAEQALGYAPGILGKYLNGTRKWCKGLTGHYIEN